MNHDLANELEVDMLLSPAESPGFDPTEAEYVDEYTLNDIGLALRVHAFADSE